MSQTQRTAAVFTGIEQVLPLKARMGCRTKDTQCLCSRSTVFFQLPLMPAHIPLPRTAHLAQMTPSSLGIPLHLTESVVMGANPHSSAGQTRLSLPWQRKGLAFVFQVLSLIFSPCFLTAMPAIGVKHGEGGREQNLVNSWGLSLFIAGLGEMWLTE